MNLPLYIIERVDGIWILYNTDTCLSLEFNTREQAELALKTLTKN